MRRYCVPFPYSMVKSSYFWKAEAQSQSKVPLPPKLHCSLCETWGMAQHKVGSWSLKSNTVLLKFLLNSQLNSLKLYVTLHPHMSTNWCSSTIRQRSWSISFYLIMSLLQLHNMSSTLKSVSIALVLKQKNLASFLKSFLRASSTAEIGPLSSSWTYLTEPIFFCHSHNTVCEVLLQRLNFISQIMCLMGAWHSNLVPEALRLLQLLISNWTIFSEVLGITYNQLTWFVEFWIKHWIHLHALSAHCTSRTMIVHSDTVTQLGMSVTEVSSTVMNIGI